MRSLLISCVLSGCVGPGVFVDSIGEGNGVVRSDPAGIECGDACAMVASGSVTLTATASAGSVFVGWEGPCTGTDVCTFEMTADVHVRARFSLDSYLLEVTPSEHGSVYSVDAGIDCGADCSEEYKHGTRVTLRAVPARRYSFYRWTNLECAGLSDCVLDVVEPRTLVAEFQADQFLTVLKIGTGSVTSSPPGISGTSAAAAEFPYGSIVTLTANATPFSSFVGWTGGCVPVGDTCVATMDRAHEVYAIFKMRDEAQPGGACTVYLHASESSNVFNARLTSGTKVCLDPGVVIDGGVAIPFGASGVTIRSLPGAPQPRIVNNAGTAVTSNSSSELVIEDVTLEANGPPGTSVVQSAGGTSVIRNSILRTTCNSCTVLALRGGVAAKILASQLIAYDGQASSSKVLDAGPSTVSIYDSVLVAWSTVIFASQADVRITRSRLDSLSPQSGIGAIDVSGSALTLDGSVVRVLGHDVIRAGMLLGDVSIWLEENELRKAAGSTAGTYAPFVMLRGGNHVFSSLPNTFCNEGTATTDGELAAPWISGTIAADSTFNSVLHVGPTNCQ